MLNKNNRLNLAQNFAKLKRDSNSLQSRYLTLLYHRNDLLVAPQIGFVVSNKVGEAVFRNRVRRQLREIIRKHLAKFTPQLQLVVIVKRLPKDITYEKLLTDFNQVLPKLPPPSNP